MSVATRLWIALGLNVALLSVVIGYHVRTLERAVTVAHDLSEVSAQLVLAQARQSERLAILDETAAKFAVTRDDGYLTKLEQLRGDVGDDLTLTTELPVGPAERSALTALEQSWLTVRDRADAFVAAGTLGDPTGPLLDQLRLAIDTLRDRADDVAAISQASMRERLADATAERDRATRVAWIAALAALLLAIVTAVVLRRSITKPLAALTSGTRAVARGHFEHRLATGWGGEFADVATDFNAMTERLGQLDRMKRDFVTTVSHDLKSPLASLRETTSLLLDEVPGPLHDAQRRVLLLQRESADRLGHMIAKLLDLSRLEAGLPLAMNNIDVARLLESTVAHAHVAGRERQVQVRLAADIPPSWRLHADEDRIRQLLDNLLENAIKFSPIGADVLLGAEADGTTLLLTVSDRGPGIDPEHAGHVFERFYQTPQGRAVPKRGAGLGLTICREVAQAHGGQIRVRPRAGGGSVFTVELPRLQSVLAAPRVAVHAVQGATA